MLGSDDLDLGIGQRSGSADRALPAGPGLSADATPRFRRALEQSPLGERRTLPVTDDEVVQYSNVDEGQRFLEARGNELVRLARLKYSRGVRMG
jgi:hypothetical protein